MTALTDSWAPPASGFNRLGSTRARRAAGLSTGIPFLGFLIGKVATEYTGLRLVLAALALTAFVGLFYGVGLVQANFTQPLNAYGKAMLAAFTALALGLPFVFGSDWLGMPIYLGLICALVLPWRYAGWGAVASVAATAVQSLLIGGDAETTVQITLTSLGLNVMMLAFRHSRTLVAQLREAQADVRRLAATEERLRIARDLHDLLGHSLSLIVLKSELARRLAARAPERVPGEINDIEAVARQALADVRAAVSGYRSRDLAEELDAARTVLTAAGVEPTIRTSGTPLPDAVDGLFGWAVREGVTNVVRHSRATRCEISVAREGGRATLEIRDDGAAAREPFVPGNGLTGLTERLTGAGGSVDAGPLPGGGFRLAVRAPLGTFSTHPVGSAG
jgi:two-component system sensor histidine kinase DesK